MTTHSVALISIMGIPVKIEYAFFDQALEWSLADMDPTQDDDNDKLLNLLLQIHYSERIETYLRNLRHWDNYARNKQPESDPPDDDLPPWF